MISKNEIILNILIYNLLLVLNNKKRTPFHIKKYVFALWFLWLNIYFILWMYHFLLRAVLKQIKRNVSSFLFKWIHRELCDAWQRTWGNNQMVETETPPGSLNCVCLVQMTLQINCLTVLMSTWQLWFCVFFFPMHNFFFYLSKRMFIPD